MFPNKFRLALTFLLICGTHGEILSSPKSIKSYLTHKSAHFKQYQSETQRYEVAIIGGGFAGLSAAMFFGRALISAVLINAESPRNKVTDATHNFLTRDGVKPTEFLKIGKEELEKYKKYVAYSKDMVTDVTKAKDGFLLKTQSGQTYLAGKVIFATGMQDHLGDLKISGVYECYGKSIYHCAFCDGFERKNKPLAVFSRGLYTANLTKIVYHWSKDLVVFTTNESLTSDEVKEFQSRGLRIITDPAVELVHKNGYMTGVKLSTGDVIPRNVGFLGSTMDSGSDLPSRLGVKKLPAGNYESTEAWGKTSVSGVYVVGDLKDSFTGAVTAAAQGYQVAYHIAEDMIQDDFWKQTNRG